MTDVLATALEAIRLRGTVYRLFRLRRLSSRT